MVSLHSLLKDDASTTVSQLSGYGHANKLTLAFILASSLLYLYPGTWLQSTWDSEKILLPRTGGYCGQIDITSPYLAVQVEKFYSGSSGSKAPPIWNYHPHPVIQTLGITLLELATETKFAAFCGLLKGEKDTTTPTNLQSIRAVQVLDEWESDGRHQDDKRIPSALRKAIRACLVLDSEAVPNQSLREEGPIRYYVLLRIVSPLAEALSTGFKVPLESLQGDKTPWTYTHESHNQSRGDRVVAPSTDRVASFGNVAAHNSPSPARCLHISSCLFGDEESAVENNKRKSATQWHKWYERVLDRIYPDGKNCLITGQQPVKIAILDTGIELSECQKDIYDRRRTMKYQSWVEDDANPTHVERDDVGHGTHLATLLARIAPHAEIHVARVFKKRKPNLVKESRNISRVKSLEEDFSTSLMLQAIRYAVDIWAVDIIVMSFGFEEEQDSQVKEHSILRSIKYASESGVTMFAAASNDGRNRPDNVAWPARSADVICIHSADGDGMPSSFTPGPGDNQRILTLGECVQSAWPEKFKQGEHKLMSGTSCAAPIAAGIAAVILSYARNVLTDADWHKLRRTEYMRKMFEGMREPREAGGYWWIRPWVLFDKKNTDGWIQGEMERAIR